jgi:uncharacterized phage protein (TIGR02220 family)
MKRPAFQFYPKDWRDEQSLRLCSMAARGLWIDLMCLMHSSERYGHLELAGKPMTAEQVARLVGESAKDVKRWMAELTDNGVCSTTPEGVLFSRRMVRDEDIRNRRAEGGAAGADHGVKGAAHGMKGGRPTKETGGEKPPFHDPKEPPSKPPPSFASAFAFASAPQNQEDLRSLSGKPDDGRQSDESKAARRKRLNADAVVVLDFLNRATGSRFQPVEANLGMIRARLAEADISTCKRVIAGRWEAWANDPKMSEYLRPATLFAARNFANYAGQLPAIEPEFAVETPEHLEDIPL